MKPANLATRTVALALLSSVAMVPSAHAIPFDDLFVFGDSYSDTGAYRLITNGSTAVGYLARDLGITLTTSKNPKPGTSGVNFAEAGARVDVGPTPPATQPRSLTQQIAEFRNYVSTGALTFTPSSSLFLLFGGLNDHTRATKAQIGAATTSQVATLYSLGARYFEVALLPSLVPMFADSATNLNPEYQALVPQLQAKFPGAVFQLSDWGPDYDAILSNPSAYGFTNATDPCSRDAACTDPNSYFFYYPSHPSDAAHQIVGDELYREALAIREVLAIRPVPEPRSLMLLGAGLLSLGLTRCRKRRRLPGASREYRQG